MVAESRVAEYIKGNPEDEQLQRILAAQGPGFIPTVVSAALQSIKEMREYLTVPVVTMRAAQIVDRRMVHCEHLVRAVASRSPDWGVQVGGWLTHSMGDQDPDVRALAALFCGADDIPSRTYARQVVEHFKLDRDELVRLAAAICIAAASEAPEQLLRESVDRVKAFLHVTKQAFPDLVRQVRMELKQDGESAQNIAIVKAAAYRTIAFR